MNRLSLTSLILAGLTAAALPAQASNRHADYARVIASAPVYEHVGRPQRECWSEPVGHENVHDRSYAGAVLGGIAGGILGSQVGQGSGRSIATAVAAATGAIVGDSIDNSGPARYASRPTYEERCRTVERSNRRLTGYDVTYRYHGRDYTTFMRQAPSDRIRVIVDVAVDDYDD